MLDGQSADAACDARPDQPSPALMLDGQGAEARPDQPSSALMLDGQGAEARPDRLKPFYIYKVCKVKDPSAIDRRLFIDVDQTATNMNPCAALQTCPEFYMETFEDLDQALLFRKMYNQAKPGHQLQMYEAIVSGEFREIVSGGFGEIVSGEVKKTRVRKQANIYNADSF